MTAAAGVHGIFVVVDQKGNVTYVDGTNGKTGQGKLKPDPKPPLSIACSEGGGVETFVIIDSAGRAWHGKIRGSQGDPKPV